MPLLSYTNAVDFLSDAHSFLYEREIQNNLTIGLVGNLTGNPVLLPNEALCAFVENKIVKATCFNSGHKVIVSCPEPTMEIAVSVYNYLLSTHSPINGYVGDTGFVDLLLSLHTEKKFSSRKMYVHQLTALNDIAIAKGEMQIATIDDTAWITEWSNLFQEEANNYPKHTIAALHKMTLNRVQKGEIYKWVVANEPMSIAAIVRHTKSTAIIGLVYTPVKYRCKGYGTAVVHELTRAVLATGKSAGLFTDAANPTSNSIYAKIGYEKTGDIQDAFYLP